MFQALHKIQLALSPYRFDMSARVERETTRRNRFNWHSTGIPISFFLSTFLCFNQHHSDVARLSFSILLISTCTHQKKVKKAEKSKKKKKIFHISTIGLSSYIKKHRRKKSWRIPRKTWNINDPLQHKKTLLSLSFFFLQRRHVVKAY